MAKKNDNASSGSSQPQADETSKQVQELVDEAEAQGFLGQKVDPTPNEHYTLDGVTSGKPTPETDADAKAKANEALGS